MFGITTLKKCFSRTIIDYYSVLGVTQMATEKEIKSKYYQLAKQYHPDLRNCQNPSDFVKIKEAYQVIGNSGERAKYDQDRQDARGNRRKNQYYEKYQKYPYGNKNENKYSNRQVFGIKLGAGFLFCSTFYFVYVLKTPKTEHDVRRDNIFLRNQNVNSSTGVQQKRRKLLQQERKQKKFDIVPIQLHFDTNGNAYMNQNNIKPSKRRNKSDKNRKTLDETPGFKKRKTPPMMENTRTIQDYYI